MPPIARPFPRFVADTPREARPYGDWLERLVDAFAASCEELRDEAGAGLDRESLRFYPDRTWGGTTYVPVVGRSDSDTGLPEFYGYITFHRESEESDPGELTAEADFTETVADDNPDWEIDLNDAVIGEWRADGGRGGEMTLIWGTPLVRGAVAASAELDGSEVLDQTAINEGRFTLLAADAVHGFGDDRFLEVKLWDRRLRELATESLYESEEPNEVDEPSEGEVGGDDGEEPTPQTP